MRKFSTAVRKSCGSEYTIQGVQSEADCHHGATKGVDFSRADEYTIPRISSIKFTQLALQNDVDVKTVSSMLGQYDAGFTLRTYTHATRQKQDEAAQTMGSFMAQVM